MWVTKERIMIFGINSKGSEALHVRQRSLMGELFFLAVSTGGHFGYVGILVCQNLLQPCLAEIATIKLAAARLKWTHRADTLLYRAAGAAPFFYLTHYHSPPQTAQSHPAKAARRWSQPHKKPFVTPRPLAAASIAPFASNDGAVLPAHHANRLSAGPGVS